MNSHEERHKLEFIPSLWSAGNNFTHRQPVWNKTDRELFSDIETSNTKKVNSFILPVALLKSYFPDGCESRYPAAT